MAPGLDTQLIDTGGVVVHQILCGREIANLRDKPRVDATTQRIWGFAASMKNFVYLVVDVRSREALVIDGCWDVDGIFTYAAELGVEILGAVYTHSHFDHAGGHVPSELTGGLPVVVPGAQTFAERKVPIWAGAADAQAIINQCQLAKDVVQSAEDGTEIRVGIARCTLFATPGHTPGSVCLHVPCGGDSSTAPVSKGTRVHAGEGALLTGDTLFVESCGRTDLPGSDQSQMFRSLSKLAQGLPANCVVCPGHDYHSVPHTTIGVAKHANAMVSLGISMCQEPGGLPPFQVCRCAQRIREAAKGQFGDGPPSIIARSAIGGEVHFFGVPSHATAAELRQVLYDFLRREQRTSGRTRRLQHASELAIAIAGANDHRPLGEQEELRPGSETMVLTLMNADLPPSEVEKTWYSAGQLVKIEGLQGAAELNGQQANVDRYDAAKGRYTVRMAAGGGLRGVRPDNLRIVPPSKPDHQPSKHREAGVCVEVWEVVGGRESGGLLVRTGKELASPEATSRLGTGSLVQQSALVGDRLHYKLLQGSGPETGWVSLKLKGRELCVRVPMVSREPDDLDRFAHTVLDPD